MDDEEDNEGVIASLEQGQTRGMTRVPNVVCLPVSWV